jgi:hypothetical protein
MLAQPDKGTAALTGLVLLELLHGKSMKDSAFSYVAKNISIKLKDLISEKYHILARKTLFGESNFAVD